MASGASGARRFRAGARVVCALIFLLGGVLSHAMAGAGVPASAICVCTHPKCITYTRARVRYRSSKHPPALSLSVGLLQKGDGIVKEVVLFRVTVTEKRWSSKKEIIWLLLPSD